MYDYVCIYVHILRMYISKEGCTAAEASAMSTSLLYAEENMHTYTPIIMYICGGGYVHIYTHHHVRVRRRIWTYLHT